MSQSRFEIIDAVLDVALRSDPYAADPYKANELVLRLIDPLKSRLDPVALEAIEIGKRFRAGEVTEEVWGRHLKAIQARMSEANMKGTGYSSRDWLDGLVSCSMAMPNRVDYGFLYDIAGVLENLSYDMTVFHEILCDEIAEYRTAFFERYGTYTLK